MTGWFFKNKILEKFDVIYSNDEIVFANKNSDVSFLVMI